MGKRLCEEPPRRKVLMTPITKDHSIVVNRKLKVGDATDSAEERAVSDLSIHELNKEAKRSKVKAEFFRQLPYYLPTTTANCFVVFKPFPASM